VTAAIPALLPLDTGSGQLLRRMRLAHTPHIASAVLATPELNGGNPVKWRAPLTVAVARVSRSSLASRRARAAVRAGKPATPGTSDCPPVRTPPGRSCGHHRADLIAAAGLPHVP
jgi:hypothetical protein